MNSNARISVYIVSYNQEKYIRQSVDSVLEQSVQPYEICIFDDHSVDKTWDIIQEYQQKYPNVIKAYRHDNNQGIFKNLNFAEDHLSGNLITAVAGDDFIKPGYFEHVCRCIEDNNLNPDIDSFIIVPNIINLFDNGLETKYSNVGINDKNLVKLRLRGLVDDRYGVVSRCSLESTGKFIEDIGIYSDFVWGLDRYIHTKKIYFIDGYYSVYRQGVGIVSRTKEADAARSLVSAIDILTDRFKSELDSNDINYLKYLKMKSNYLIHKSFRHYLNLVGVTLLNIGNFGSWGKQMKAFTFIILPYKLKMILFKVKYIESLSK